MRKKNRAMRDKATLCNAGYHVLRVPEQGTASMCRNACLKLTEGYRTCTIEDPTALVFKTSVTWQASLSSLELWSLALFSYIPTLCYSVLGVPE